MIGDRTYRSDRVTRGTLRHKQLYSHTFGYTETRKKVAAADTDAVLASTVLDTGAETITSGITNPDVPRVLSITTGGTAGDIAAGTVTITGTNVEGKTITDDFTVSANTAETIEGTKAFKTVASVAHEGQDGAAAELSVGYLDKIGLNHRLIDGETTIKIFSETSANNGTTAPTLQGTPTLTADAEEVENNYVAPATASDGTTFLTIVYEYDKFAASTTNDEPDYSTTTSTSTTTTSTSSTSVSTSTSSTSSSTSSTSSSTSSTSTSTTTTP